jgi:superkiller protein 3
MRNFHQEALNELENLRHNSPENLSLYLKMSRIYRSRQMFEESLEILNQARMVAPQDISVTIEIARLYLACEDFARVIEVLQEARQTHPGNSDISSIISEAYARSGDHEMAIMELKSLINQDRGNYAARVQLGRIYSISNMIDQATMTFKDILAEKSDHSVAHVELVRIYINMGKAYNDESMIDSGVNEIKTAISLDADCIMAHFELGLAHNDSGRLNEALTEFSRVLELDPLHIQAKEHYQALTNVKINSQANEGIKQARIFSERGMFKNAIMEYEKVIELQHNNQIAWYELGNLHLSLEAYDQALEALQKAKEINPEQPEIYVSLATTFIKTGQPDEASIELQELLGMFPTHYHGLFMLGHIFQEKGWVDEAIEKYQAAWEVVPTELEPILQLGIMFRDKGDHESARVWFQRVIEIDAGNLTASDFFANLSASQRSQEIDDAFTKAAEAENSGDVDAAIMHYDSIIDLDNHNLDARFKLGVLYESKNMFDEATFEYEQAITLDKTARYRELPLRLGNLHIRKGKIVEAVDALTLAKKYFPNNVDIRIELITQLKFKALNNFTSKEELAEFNDSIRQATQQGNNYCDWLELGLFLSKGLDETIDEESAITQSIECFEKVIELDAGNVFAMTELAKVFHRRNNLANVESIYKQILEKDPESIYVHRKLADLYHSQGRYDEALSELRQLLELDPANGDCHMKIIDISKEMMSKAQDRDRQLLAILKEYQSRAEASPKDPMANFSLGYAYITLGSGFTPTEEEQQKAVYYFKLANSNDPNNLWPYWGLKIVYSKQSISGKHMYDEAIAICRKALKVDENNARAHYELGEAYNENYDINMKNEAMAEYRKAIQLDPNYIEAHFRLASIYRVKNMYDRASEEYNKVIELDPTGPLANDAKRSLVHIERSKGES